MNTRDFKGIWIPKELYLRKDLSITEKIVLAEIDSLDCGEGCREPNSYFSNFADLSESHISRIISKLKDLGLLSQTSFNGRERILKSKLKITTSPEKDEEQTTQKCGGRLRKNAEAALLKQEEQPCSENAPNQRLNAETKGSLAQTGGAALLGKDRNHSYINSNININTCHTTAAVQNAAGVVEKYKKDSVPYLLCEYLLAWIQDRKPDFRQPNLQSHTWCKQMELLLRRDKKSKAKIMKVIDWCQNNSFWQINILSPNKLRIQFDRLEMQMNQELGIEAEEPNKYKENLAFDIGRMFQKDVEPDINLEEHKNILKECASLAILYYEEYGLKDPIDIVFIFLQCLEEEQEPNIRSLTDIQRWETYLPKFIERNPSLLERLKENE